MLSASIVLYKNNYSEVEQTVLCFFKHTENLMLYLIDNSPNDDLKVLRENHLNIIYIHNPLNPGFGAGHNIAITKAISSGAKYHFIVNPDVFFTEDVVSLMIDYIIGNPSIGMMMPQILNFDGSVQNLPKLLPSPFSILLRKLKKPKGIYDRFIEKYELRFVDNEKIYEAPVLSGCFTLLNLSAVEKIGMYDDRFFMYFEDWDLSRRIHAHYKTLYFPLVSVYHGYESGANKNLKLFSIYLKSAFRYFNKWGWFFDKNRKNINNHTLGQFNNE